MAVAISQTANPSGVSAASTIATYVNAALGTVAADRIIVVAVASELASSTPSKCTIDIGFGEIPMVAGTGGNLGDVYSQLYYLHLPAGTLGTIRVTFSATSPSNTANHIAVYKVTGGKVSSTGADGSTDMDSTDPLTTGSITIPTDGGFLAVAGGATDGTGKTWANATEDIDADAGGLRFTTATRTTALTTTAVTCTGGTNGEDGAMSWIIFTTNEAPTTALGTPADAGSVSDATPALTFTGTDAQSEDVRYQMQISSLNFPAITLDTSGGVSTSATTQVTQSITVAAGNNRKMIVVVANNDNGTDPDAPSGVTYAGVALTKVADKDEAGTGEANVSIWELAAPAVGTANLVVTSTGTFQFIDIGWLVVQNASQNVTYGSGHYFLNVQNPKVNIPIPLYGSWAVSCGYPHDSAASGTITGATEFQGGSFPDMGYSGASTSDDGPAQHIYGGAAATEDWTVAWVPILPSYADGLIQGVSGGDTSLTDNFDDNSIHAKWTTYTASSGTIAETSQQLHFSLAATTTGSWSGLYSATPIDFRGMYAQMEIVSATTGDTWLDLTIATSGLNADHFFSIGLDVSGAEDNGGTPGIVAFEVDEDFGGTVLSVFNYNSSLHKYLRIREFGGIVYWDWSTDGSSWTNFFSKNTNIDLRSVYVVLDDFEYSSSTTPNTHIIDNFSIGAWQGSAFTRTADSDPFTSAQETTYTVTSPDEMDDGTYYWRVRGKDPTGTNSYGAWTTARSFTLTESVGTVVKDIIGSGFIPFAR